MKNSKIKSLRELQKICLKLRKEGKTIGLITGCFDVMHAGHVRLFELARKKVDYVLVGLDTDQTVALSKGSNRPIFSQRTRAFVISNLHTVDYVFFLRKKYNYSTTSADLYHKRVRDILNPHALITNVRRDRFWKAKRASARERGMKFINLRHKDNWSSSNIIEKLGL